MNRSRCHFVAVRNVRYGALSIVEYIAISYSTPPQLSLLCVSQEEAEGSDEEMVSNSAHSAVTQVTITRRCMPSVAVINCFEIIS